MKIKLRRVVLNPMALISLMTKGSVWRVENGVPDDADLWSFTIDPATMNLILFIKDESFEPINVQDTVAPLLVLEVRKVQ